jgi:hypothetical protein
VQPAAEHAIERMSKPQRLTEDSHEQ